MMTRKDYIKLAAMIREADQHEAVDRDYAEGWHAGICAVRLRLVEYLAADNPNFDRARFLEACGLEPQP